MKMPVILIQICENFSTVSVLKFIDLFMENYASTFLSHQQKLSLQQKTTLECGCFFSIITVHNVILYEYIFSFLQTWYSACIIRVTLLAKIYTKIDTLC